MLEGYIRDTRYVTVVTSLATANTQESLLFSAKSLATHSTEAPLKQPVWYIMTRLALGLRLSSPFLDGLDSSLNSKLGYLDFKDVVMNVE
jgi:hypothetical protein